MIERVYRLIAAWERQSAIRRRIITLSAGGLFLLVLVGYLAYANSRPGPLPTGTPTPGPSSSAAPCRTGSLPEQKPDGNLCAFISGFVASPADINGVSAPISGGLVYASLQSLDSGGILPPQTLYTTSSDSAGAFGFPIPAAANWRILYGVQGQLGLPISQNLITVVSQLGPNDQSRTAYPVCGSATSANLDATFHLAGDVRLVMRITPCPDGSVLASVVQYPIELAANATPGPTPAPNPALVGVNDSTNLRYDPALLAKTRIIESGNTPLDPAVIAFLVIGLVGLIALGFAAWWVSFSLRDLAHTDLKEEES